MRPISRSQQSYQQSQLYFPGGVNSPVRAFKSVDGDPRFIRRAKGAYLWDEDGHRYIDYINSWGPAIVGHAHDEVLEAIQHAAQDGLSFGAPTCRETALAEQIQTALPSMQKIRYVSSGTEACMSVIRVARAFTKRDLILKFDGCYHGHADPFLVKAGSGVATFGLPDSPGVPKSVTEHTLSIPYNDLEALDETCKRVGDQLAAIILEPIVGNSGFIRPSQDFLQALRKYCDQHGILLIFDEVMTGFRVAWGGAQRLFDMQPDLTTLGKVIGGGLPLAAFGGRADVMALVAPEGPVYQAGTLSGNPLAVASGSKTLEILSQPNAFASLERSCERLTAGMKGLADEHGIQLSCDFAGGMFGFSFRPDAPRNFADAQGADIECFKRFFKRTLDLGIYFAPSAYEAGFLSLSHTDTDIDETLAAVKQAFLEESQRKVH